MQFIDCHKQIIDMKQVFPGILFAGLLLLIVPSCQSSGDFTKSEQTLILEQPEVMRVLTTASVEDSLLLIGTSADIPVGALRGDVFCTLASKMVTTVTSPSQDGVGIAGPQVGVLRRVVAVQRFDKDGAPFEVYPNIRIVARRGEMVCGPEGCLSVPGVRGDVPRYRDIDIVYTSVETLTDTVETVKGFSAVIFQHECDHLDGVLFPKRMLKPQE